MRKGIEKSKVGNSEYTHQMCKRTHYYVSQVLPSLHIHVHILTILYLTVPPRILIHQYFILKILNTDSDPKNTDRDPNIRVLAILECKLQ